MTDDTKVASDPPRPRARLRTILAIAGASLVALAVGIGVGHAVFPVDPEVKTRTVTETVEVTPEACMDVDYAVTDFENAATETVNTLVEFRINNDGWLPPERLNGLISDAETSAAAMYAAIDECEAP